MQTSIFNANGDSLLGPLIIGTFEKRAPGAPGGDEQIQFSPCFS